MSTSSSLRQQFGAFCTNVPLGVRTPLEAPGLTTTLTAPKTALCVCPPLDKGSSTTTLSMLFNYLGQPPEIGRGMERTCEAPSNEAPHMILGYRQGRLPTYLQSTVAHAVHSFGLIHGFSCAPSPKQVSHCSFQPPVHCSQPRE